MKAISLWQPWASALMLGKGFKEHETRHWSTNYRGLVAIHAAKRWTRDEVYALDELVSAGFPLNSPPRGCVLGYAELRDCVEITDVSTPPRMPRDRIAGNWTPGRFAWRFTNHVLLPEPIPYRGAQGFFDVPDSLLNVVAVQSASATPPQEKP